MFRIVLSLIILSIHLCNCQQSIYKPIVFEGDTSKCVYFRLKHLNNTLRVRVQLSIQLNNDNPPSPALRVRVRESRNYNDSIKSFTINEAIEAFRKDLVEKEINIGGIIESPSVFYRHFNLKYDNCEIRLRCSYYSNYQYRKLNIYCFEYNSVIESQLAYNRREEEKERSEGGRGGVGITSPLFEEPDKSINIRTIDLKDYSQTLHMHIQ